LGRFDSSSSRDRENAWDEFLETFAPLVLQVVRLFEHDPDRVDDCFVFVCEQLRRDDLRRLRQFDDDGPASFPTWLRAVIRNLCLDWRRSRFGRPRMFRAVERLSLLDQEVYGALHLRELDEAGALEAVRTSYPDLSPEEFAESQIRIAANLTPHQSWLLASHRLRLVSLSGNAAADDGEPRAPEPVDEGPSPEQQAARGEEIEALRAALTALAPADRLLLRMRFEQDMTLEAIGRLTGRGSAATVMRAIQAAVDTLRQRVEMQSDDEASVEEG
jgi:RNA polymerase sigma factor (sigma-70 family)